MSTTEDSNQISPKAIEAICKRITMIAFDVLNRELVDTKTALENNFSEATAYWLGYIQEQVEQKRDRILQDVIGVMWEHELTEIIPTAIVYREAIKNPQTSMCLEET